MKLTSLSSNVSALSKVNSSLRILSGNRRMVFCSVVTVLLIGSACLFRKNPTESTIAKVEQEQSLEKTSEFNGSDDPLSTRFFEGDPKGAEAWRKFISTGRYSLARLQDFQFSEATRRNLSQMFGESWQSRIHPYTGGEINHDSFYHDSAYIVVDSATNSANKFGIVIFNEQPGDAPSKEYWLYKDRDLSKTVFGWASSGLHLQEFNDRGEYSICYVNWNKSRQEYSCDPRPKQ